MVCVVAEVVEYVIIWRSSVPFLSPQSCTEARPFAIRYEGLIQSLGSRGKRERVKNRNSTTWEGSRRKLRDRRNTGCKQELSPKRIPILCRSKKV